jgi:hypothetical protein
MPKDLTQVNQALMLTTNSIIDLQVLLVRSIQREIEDDKIRELMNYELV